MLQISAGQWAALERSSYERFVRAVTRFLRDRYEIDAKAIDDASLEDFVRSQIEHARRYAITDRQCLGNYAALAVEYGADFDRGCGWAEAILNRALLSQHDKLRWLEEYAAMAVDRRG